MISKYVIPGNKLEIQEVDRVKFSSNAEKKKIYESQVYDIISEDRLEITMPMEKSKMLLLPVDAEYDLHFYTDTGLYQCYAKIIDRYKSRSVYILLVDLTSNLRKYQRREFYRFACALEVDTRPLEKEEIEMLGEKKEELAPELPLKRSVVVDISGGGLRFLGNYSYEPESLILCKYHLIHEGMNKEYNLSGKVLSVHELENRSGIFEHRVQYINIDNSEREEIIKFIFEEERKYLRKAKGL